MSDRWPRLMKSTTAAQYCDLSEAAFKRAVLEGTLPLPSSVKIGARDHWDKLALDAAISKLEVNDDQPDYRRKLRGRYGYPA